ncbi:MAG: HAMP domain-containing histidine kinase [Gemmatimonadetes bacterium]|nr:HAMP domain-containing histidine kinase [Gemmatimonadota bacterium]
MKRKAALPGATGRRVEIRGAPGPLWVDRFLLDEPELEGHLLLVQTAASVEALETNLRFADRMRSVKDSARIMAHDVKAPLNAIVLRLDLLQQDLTAAARLPKTKREELLDHVDVVQEELTRVQRILQSFLSQTGPATEHRRRFDLRRIAREVATLMRPQAERSGVRVEVQLGADALPVHAFRDQIKQALINITTNAVEAMAGRDDAVLTFRAARRGKTAELRIQDSGPGFADGAEDRVFEMHYTSKEHGSGIGLFVARSILREHEGSIRLGNLKGGGAEATVRLPLARENEED